MLQELEKTLKDHQSQLDHLQKTVSRLEVNSQQAQKLTYTVKEVAAALGVKETTIRTWIADGKLQAVQTGKTLLITADNLMKLIKPKKSKSKS